MIATTVDEFGTRRAVTKLVDDERLVSCTCCTAGESCCVYPASCGLGPASITFYGGTLSGSSGTYGDTTNGVILESGVWAVYRNSVRTTTDCIGMATIGSVSIAAILPSSLSLSFVFSGNTYTSTLAFSGAVDPLNISDTALFGDTGGQCYWNGPVDGGGQDFDSGFNLLFNPANCRWELASGPLDFVYAYRSDASPVGVYVAADPNLSSVVIT